MKKTFKIIVFVILTSLILLAAYKVFSWKDTSGDYYSSIAQLRATQDNSVDAVFVGSSRVYCAIAPHVFWKEAGIAAFDMSISGMDKRSELYYTKYFLRHQKPKIICVDAYSFTFDKHDVESNEYRNMLAMPTSGTQIDLVKDYNADDSKSMKEYILKWPIIHTRYKELDKGDFITEGFGLYGRGECLNETRAEYDIDFLEYADTETITPVDGKNKELIDGFIALSEKYDIPVLFYVSPALQLESEVSVYNGIEDYVKGYENISFVNFNNEAKDMFEDTGNFCDAVHLSKDGAEKFSRKMMEYLSNMVEFTDRRGTPGYDLWEMDALYYDLKETDNRIKKMIDSGTDAYGLIEEAVNNDYLTYIVSLDGHYYNYDYCYEEILEVIGASWEEAESGGTWIGHGGECVKVADRDSKKPVFYDLDRYNAVKIDKNEDDDVPSVSINGTGCQQIDSGVNVVVWDSINKEIVGVLGWN